MGGYPMDGCPMDGWMVVPLHDVQEEAVWYVRTGNAWHEETAEAVGQGVGEKCFLLILFIDENNDVSSALSLVTMYDPPVI